MTSKFDLSSLVSNWQNSSTTAKEHWSGTFGEYLDLVKQNPKATRNAYQRMYDMIVDEGTENYVDFKKDVIRYKFFDDTFNNGKDAVFGLDVQLMKLVNVLKAAALGYGTEKRVILLHGPVGSAKSTICRLLKKGLERYSHQPQGGVYTFEWIDEKLELDGILGKGVKVFPSPMNEEPLLLIPDDLRQSIFDSINKGQEGSYRVNVDGELSPPSRFIFKNLMEKYDGDLMKVLSHVRVRRMFISEADRIGIGTFQPKDEKNQDSTELTGDINYRKIATLILYRQLLFKKVA
jgi:serine protein kinase